jgi:Spy/CpxP family protein refolding chaperone
MTHITRLLLTAAAASIALAQGPGPRQDARPGNPGGAPPDPQTMIQRRVESLSTLLGLTTDQKAKATAIFTNSFSAGENLRTSLQTTQQSLMEAVKKNDTTAIDQLSAMAGTITGQLMAIERKADAAFYALLTEEQKAKLDAMPRGGPGFGPGPGPARRMGPRF